LKHALHKKISRFVAWFCSLYSEPSTSRHDKEIIGFTCGAFDLLHAGHIMMLKEASEQCDYLVVGLQYDPSVDRPEKNKPVQSYQERTVVLKSVKYVDKVVFYETESDLVKLLCDLQPDVRIIGFDWKGKQFTGSNLPIKLYFNSRDHSWSTSDLRDRIFVSEVRKRIQNEEEEINKE